MKAEYALVAHDSLLFALEGDRGQLSVLIIQPDILGARIVTVQYP